MSQLKGSLCDFCQCPIGHVEDGDALLRASDFVQGQIKQVKHCKIYVDTAHGQDYDLELCEECFDNLKAKADELITYIKSQKKDRPRIQIAEEVVEG